MVETSTPKHTLRLFIALYNPIIVPEFMVIFGDIFRSESSTCLLKIEQVTFPDLLMVIALFTALPFKRRCAGISKDIDCVSSM